MLPCAGHPRCPKQAPFPPDFSSCWPGPAWRKSVASRGKGSRPGASSCATRPTGCRPHVILRAPGLCPGGSPGLAVLPTFPYSRAHRAESTCLQSREEPPQLRLPVVASRTSTSALPTTQFTLKWEDFPGWRTSVLLTPVGREWKERHECSSPMLPGPDRPWETSAQDGASVCTVLTFNPWPGYGFPSA